MEDPAYLNARGLLSSAVLALAGAGDIRERLYKAAKAMLPLRPRHLPDYLHEDYETLWQALTWLTIEEPDEGTLRATLRAMDDREAERLAKAILGLYLRVVEASHADD